MEMEYVNQLPSLSSAKAQQTETDYPFHLETPPPDNNGNFTNKQPKAIPKAAAKVPRLKELSLKCLERAECQNYVIIDDVRSEGQNFKNHRTVETNESLGYSIELAREEPINLTSDCIGSMSASQLDSESMDLQSELASCSFGADHLLDNMANQMMGQQQYMFNALNTVSPVYAQNNISAVDFNSLSQNEQFISSPSFIELQPQGIATTNMTTTLPVVPSELNDNIAIRLEDQYLQTPQSQPMPSTSTPVSAFRVLKPLKPNNRYYYTPHPSTGQQLLYITDEGASPQLFHKLKPRKSKTPKTSAKKSESDSQFKTPRIRVAPNTAINSSTCSSGEEVVAATSEAPPKKLEFSSTKPKELVIEPVLTVEEKLAQLLAPSYEAAGDGEETREQHNLKERRRRARIKDACDIMRKLVPGMCDKTDKATVFEFAARYIYFLKEFTGNGHDKDFLKKYSPY